MVMSNVLNNEKNSSHVQIVIILCTAHCWHSLTSLPTSACSSSLLTTEEDSVRYTIRMAGRHTVDRSPRVEVHLRTAFTDAHAHSQADIFPVTAASREEDRGYKYSLGKQIFQSENDRSEFLKGEAYIHLHVALPTDRPIATVSVVVGALRPGSATPFCKPTTAHTSSLPCVYVCVYV